MPASPAMRCSPGRESRADNHKRGRSLENGIVFKERGDDDLALFSEVQSRETDNFLLQSNDDFEDMFVTKLRHFSDHKIGINIAARGESSDLLNTEEEKNDYEWLITPPDTPLFPSLDDEPPQVIPAQRGRPRAQPISISRSSTMERSHRSSRGSPSPNRLSPSSRSHEPAFQPRNRPTSASSSSPPPTRRPATGPRRSPSPSSKPSSPPPRASTPTTRRLSTGSTSTLRGISGNLASSKVKAWQVNIPGFSTEAPPNLRTSLADRPASYTRGSSPASRNGRKSMSPVASRSISSSHSKGSIASSGDDDVESLPSVIVDGSERLNSRRVSGFRNNNFNNNYNKVPSPQKPSRTVSSSSAPKRSFDMALRQMDHRKRPQNMFRPLLSSVPTSNIYAEKSSPAWNSSVTTTSSNASSDFGNGGSHDIQENELNDDDATSGITKIPDCNVDEDAIFMLEKTDSLNEDVRNETHDAVTSAVLDDFKGQDDKLVCSRCGCEYSVITQTEDEANLCLNCQMSTSTLTVSDAVTSIVGVASFEPGSTMSDRDHELVNNTMTPQLTLVKDDTPELTCIVESQSEQHEDLVKDSTSCEPIQSQRSVDFPKLKVGSLEREGISVTLKRSSSVKVPVTRSGNFSASSISYDALSYMSASSSVDFGSRLQSQLSSRKSDMENYKFDPMSIKHRRSISSLSATSSHAFHPSSIGTSTLDSLEVTVAHVDKDVVDSASVGPQENADSVEVPASEPLNIEQPTEAESATHQTAEPLNIEQPTDADPQENRIENDTCTEIVDSKEVEDSGKDADADADVDADALMTCTVEEATSVTPCVDSADGAEVQPGVLSEEEVDHTCLSSPDSQSRSSQHSETKIEEFQDPHASAAVSKDVTVSATDMNSSNHSSSIIGESMVMVEGEGGKKGRSMTLEEATDAILFCSSIVQNLAYEAATIAIDKETTESPTEPSGNNEFFPLVPAVTRSYSGRKDLQSRKSSKRSSKSRKTKRKTVEGDAVKDPNNINSGEETEVAKTRMVYSNNKENTKPQTLEVKCNCRIM